MSIPQISIAEYDYDLPSARIAKYPLARRDESKLLVYRQQKIEQGYFKQLSSFLPNNTLLVFNNTKVIRARLRFQKATGAQIEIFCLEPHVPTEAALAFEAKKEVQWQCLIGNAKKWKEGKVQALAETSLGSITVFAERVAKLGDGAIVRFSWEQEELSFAEIMEGLGQTPIPPYLERAAEDIDKERYQTVYSKYLGSVAAPTAGLHFSPTVLSELERSGTRVAELTLHVGAGTFKPVKAETIDGHEMHTEHFEIDTATLKLLAAHTGPLIAVGTTSVRTLESLYRAAQHLKCGKDPHQIRQWDGFSGSGDLSRQEALETLIGYLEANKLPSFKAATSIIVAPGYRFGVVDGLITNFHQPRSTLLLLIAAIVGERWKDIYRYALDHDFRFLSYGDSSLILR
ncbi:MAG TPA: S-adenosylmethionine:tRNA ribosyltransferase-isomerase [Bacteroidales bacterium]|jgi:S-adenosylmethionine:tRNA ribosyltransferase-isomerase|nr:S-adenosylmethionine:tRNA ribosyltransferase-isomerase [Bacteroidales bacterium]